MKKTSQILPHFQEEIIIILKKYYIPYLRITIFFSNFKKFNDIKKISVNHVHAWRYFSQTYYVLIKQAIDVRLDFSGQSGCLIPSRSVTQYSNLEFLFKDHCFIFFFYFFGRMYLGPKLNIFIRMYLGPKQYKSSINYKKFDAI